MLKTSLLSISILCAAALGDEASPKPPAIRFTAPMPENNDRFLGYPVLDNTETTTLYEAKPETGTYSHHPYITQYEGVLYAMWSSHLKDEDAPGQRIMMRRSINQGKTWEPMVELFPALDIVDTIEKDGKDRRTQCANGFVKLNSKLYGISEVWDDGGNCRTSGQGKIAREIHSDGTLGDIFWVREKAPIPKAGLRPYPTGDETLVKNIQQYLDTPPNEPAWGFRLQESLPKAADGRSLCEPAPAWKINTNTWAKLYRDKTKKTFRNYVSYSTDDGVTWTKAVITEFPDASSRSNAGVLPDGQAYVINNPSTVGRRKTLCISLSADKATFNRTYTIRYGAPPLKYQGKSKGPGYHYPHSTILANNLWVIYSVGKEDIQVTKIPLKELALQADK